MNSEETLLLTGTSAIKAEMASRIIVRKAFRRGSGILAGWPKRCLALSVVGSKNQEAAGPLSFWTFKSEPARSRGFAWELTE